MHFCSAACEFAGDASSAESVLMGQAMGEWREEVSEKMGQASLAVFNLIHALALRMSSDLAGILIRNNLVGEDDDQDPSVLIDFLFLCALHPAQVGIRANSRYAKQYLPSAFERVVRQLQDATGEIDTAKLVANVLRRFHDEGLAGMYASYIRFCFGFVCGCLWVEVAFLFPVLRVACDPF
jgi:hypothetical protein